MFSKQIKLDSFQSSSDKTLVYKDGVYNDGEKRKTKINDIAYC